MMAAHQLFSTATLHMACKIAGRPMLQQLGCCSLPRGEQNLTEHIIITCPCCISAAAMAHTSPHRMCDWSHGEAYP